MRNGKFTQSRLMGCGYQKDDRWYVMLQLVPPKLVPPDHLWQPQLVPPGPFAALQMVPPDQLWRRGWSPFATSGPPYNPAFIAFLLNHRYIKN